MATYFDNESSEIQTPPDGLHRLYLMNPNYVPNSLFSDTTTTKHQHLLLNTLAGIPVSTTTATASTNSDNHHSRSFLHGFTAPRGLHYNLWGPVTDQVPTGLAACDRMTTGYDYSGGGGFVSSEIGFLKSSMASPTTQQGLSLTLSSSHDQSHAYNNSGDDDHVRVLQGNSPLVQSAIVSKGFCGVQSSVVLGSRYLKAAQELLDDVVNLDSEGTKDKMKVIRESTALIGASSSAAGHHQSSSKQGVEHSTAQRQELQMKKSKLVTMLDEVEQRYRQYHHQVQYIISSFEQAAGFGSAKSYTALALQTISKQFRCLKDAIAAQIKATSKNLGEEECLGAKTEGSRLSYIHHHVRQQRELQQLRMIQQNAWRPQRGLPERAVSVLRAWLFEHFLHPYPKDSDKVMLAKQTGLTRSQVSNWFINARVRLWKPMVEEMYLEDTKEQEQINGNSENKTEPNKESVGSTTAEIKAIRSNPEKFTNLHQQHHSPPNEILNSRILHSQSGFNLRGSPKKPRSSILSTDERDMKASETSRNGGGYGSGSATCPISEIGRGFSMNHDQQLAPRFHGNGVSLTLGLPHNNNNNNNNVQDQLLGRRLEMETREETSDDFCAINYMQLQPQPAASHSDTGYEDMDMQSRKRFAAQFLPDFVA